VEHRFEGDRQARIKLDAAPWSAAKLLRRGGKQLVWLAIGLWTGFTFVAYFTPAKALAAEVLSLGVGPWETFWMLFYGLATYGNAGYMREQVCKYMYPYARFQSAMIVRDTLIISYDTFRGEPRGSRRRGVDPKSVGKGDHRLHPLRPGLPTGIDIRKGLQYECIRLRRCIDACDEVMDKMRGSQADPLRHQNGMEKRWTRREMWRQVADRVLVYILILAAVATGFVATIACVHRSRPTSSATAAATSSAWSPAARSRTSIGCS
jgi:cytochrome c oxidase accessory protein FixG